MVAVEAIEAIAPHTLCCADEIAMVAALDTVRTFAGAENASRRSAGETAGTECPLEQVRRQIASSTKRDPTQVVSDRF